MGSCAQCVGGNKDVIILPHCFSDPNGLPGTDLVGRGDKSFHFFPCKQIAILVEGGIMIMAWEERVNPPPPWYCTISTGNYREPEEYSTYTRNTLCTKRHFPKILQYIHDNYNICNLLYMVIISPQ